MCVCVCACIYTYIHKYIHAYIHIHTYEHTYTFMCVYIRMHIVFLYLDCKYNCIPYKIVSSFHNLDKLFKLYFNCGTPLIILNSVHCTLLPKIPHHVRTRTNTHSQTHAHTHAHMPLHTNMHTLAQISI